MADASNLAKQDSANLRRALTKLGKIYGLKDRNTFMQILLLNATANEDGGLPTTSELFEDSAQTNTELEKLAEAILGLVGEGMYVSELVAVFDEFVAGTDDDDMADALKSTDSSIMSITAPNTSDASLGYMRDKSVATILGVSEFTEESGSIAVVEMHHPNLNFSNRDTVASAIMLMSIPSIEISKAVPFFDVKTIVKGSPIDPAEDDQGSAMADHVFSNGMSIYKFLHGERIEGADELVKTLVSAIPAEFTTPEPVLDGQAGEMADGPVTPSIAVAGMELFTSPQTMVNGDLEYIDLDASDLNYGPGAQPENIPLENKVLDKFRPLLTWQSFSVQVTPATGMLATKSAEAKVMLHDKTRMNQVIPLVTPAGLGDVELQVEWGWSHPQSDPEINPFGALINSMRVKEKYGLMNSSYTFTPEGQVDISLKLYTKGATNATFELVSNDPSGEHPLDVLKSLISAIRSAMKGLKQEGYTLNTEMGAPDVLGKASSTKGLLSLTEEERGQIKTFINNMKRSSSSGAADNWNELSDAWEEADASVEDFQEAIVARFQESINNCTARTSTDPYLVCMKQPEHRGTYLKVAHNTHVSLAKVLLEFVAKPIWATKKFDEVQLIFYPMNEYAMFARDLNVGQYPINKAEFKEMLIEELKVTPSMTIQKFLNTMRKLFINNIADDIYGLSSFYTKNEEGKDELQEQYTKDPEAKQAFQAKKAEIMALAYTDPGAQKTFKKPNVQMWVECVKHQDNPAKTILRLHFFDKATTSYASYAALWQASSNKDLGVVGKMVSADRQYQHALENPPPDGSNREDIENWEELVENRQNRRNRHAEHAESQMQEFIDNGLMEGFEVNVTQTNEDGSTETVPTTKFRVRGGPDQIRGILARNMPTIKYGTEYSGVLSANLATMSNPAMETIHMQRAGSSGNKPTGAQDDGLPMQVKPVELSIDTFGCPFINFGQQFFVDFQTNTSIDDIYAVSGVSHSMTPGEFKTSLKLTPLNKTGQFRAMTDSFADAMAVVSDTGGNIET